MLLTIPPLPDMPVPMVQPGAGHGASAGREFISVSMATETRQNAVDQSIAHIASGGLGGS